MELIEGKWKAVSFAKIEFITPEWEYYEIGNPDSPKQPKGRAPSGPPLPNLEDYLRRRRERRDKQSPD